MEALQTIKQMGVALKRTVEYFSVRLSLSCLIDVFDDNTLGEA